MVRSSALKAVRLLIKSFLVQQSITHDDDILEYIVDSATDATVSADALDELLSGCAPVRWGARNLDSRLAQLSRLLVQVAQCQVGCDVIEGRGAGLQTQSNTEDRVVRSHVGEQQPAVTVQAPHRHPHQRAQHSCTAQQGAARRHAAGDAERRGRQNGTPVDSTRSVCIAALLPVEKGGIEVAVDTFLQQHGRPALREPAIADYVQGLLADRNAEDDTGTVEQLDDVLCGFDGGCWAALNESARHAALCSLLAEIGALLRKSEQEANAAQRPPAHAAPTDSTAAYGTAATSTSGDAAETEAAEVAGVAASSTEADPAAIAMLQELCCNGASSDFLAHVLMRRCHGDLEAAAQQLVELDGELPRQEAAWHKSQAAASAAGVREAAAAAAERRRLFARFDLQAVPEGNSSGRRSKKGQAAVDAWQPADGAKGNVRYRDGRLVSTRGEKYIVESLNADYDGGSRGRVKTKGKRGVGFV